MKIETFVKSLDLFRLQHVQTTLTPIKFSGTDLWTAGRPPGPLRGGSMNSDQEESCPENLNEHAHVDLDLHNKLQSCES